MSDIKKEMLDAGWRVSKRGACEYWAFEDSGSMSFEDARRLHKECTELEQRK